MKTTLTVLGMLAAVGSAYKPGQYLHFRANGTEIDAHPSDNPVLPTGLNRTSEKPGIGVTMTVTDIVTDRIYTMTMGTGTAAKRTTRTLRTTIQKTITLPYAAPTAAPTFTDEPTTTVWSTAKVTRTIRMKKKKKPTGTADNIPTGTADNLPTTTGKENCPAATTVTVERIVYLPAPTVYVTAGIPGNCTADQKPTAIQISHAKPASSIPGDDYSTPTLKPTTPVAPYPYPAGNGTHHNPTSGGAQPTGVTYVRRHY